MLTLFMADLKPLSRTFLLGEGAVRKARRSIAPETDPVLAKPPWRSHITSSLMSGGG